MSPRRKRTDKELREFKAKVVALVAEVEDGSKDRADVAVMLTGYKVLRDYIELERKITEQDEVLARLAKLEEELL